MDRQLETETIHQAYIASSKLEMLNRELLLMAWQERDELRQQLILLRADLTREHLLYVNAANERTALQSKLNMLEQLQAHRNQVWTAEEVMAREG